MKTMSKTIKISAILLAVSLLLSVTSSFGESIPGKSKYSLGFQSSTETSGISGKMDYTDKIALQGSIGVFGNLTNYSGKGIYKFKSADYWDLYGFGQVGMWVWDGGTYYETQTQTSFGIGGGAGIEWDWRALSKDLPPISWNCEIGFSTASFDFYDYSPIDFGIGGHYRF